MIEPFLQRVIMLPFTEGVFGEVTVRKRSGDHEAEIYECGYTTGMQWERDFLEARRGMLVSSKGNRYASEGNAPHVKAAKGVVVIYGVPMLGSVAAAMAQKDEVKRVITVDPDRDLLDAVASNAHRQGWPNLDKMHWHEDDYGTFSRALLSQGYGEIEPPTFVYVARNEEMDPFDAQSLDDVRAVQDALKPRTIGWFGQELSFVDWARSNGDPMEEFDLDTFDKWCLHMDMVLQTRSMDYIEFATVAWAVQCARQQTLNGLRGRDG